MSDKQRDVEKCNLCGKCNATCPIFAVQKKETQSNRNKAFLIREKSQSNVLFRFLLDSSTKRTCPASIDMDEELIRHRAALIKSGIETDAGKELIDNMRRYGNPLGSVRNKKKVKPYFC